MPEAPSQALVGKCPAQSFCAQVMTHKFRFGDLK